MKVSTMTNELNLTYQAFLGVIYVCSCVRISPLGQQLQLWNQVEVGHAGVKWLVVFQIVFVFYLSFLPSVFKLVNITVEIPVLGRRFIQEYFLVFTVCHRKQNKIVLNILLADRFIGPARADPSKIVTVHAPLDGACTATSFDGFVFIGANTQIR